MKKIKKYVCFALAALLFVSLSACGGQAEMDEMQPAPSNLSVPKQRAREQKTGDIFVSPTGDDANDGSAQAPVRTPQRALALARKLAKQEKVISLAGGNYPISALTLTAEDSGVTFFAEKTAVFNGGVSLNPADFQPYRDQIQVLDLQKYGITADQIGSVKAFGQYHTAEKYGEAGSLYCELFCDGKRMTLARYPNEGEQLKTGKILDNGDSKEVYTKSGTRTNADWETMKNPRGGTFQVERTLTQRMKTWKKPSDAWLFGYFQYDWADSTTPLATFEEESVTTKYASVYGFKEGMPYYFFNVFEELDAENEWYLDRENLMLYWIPPEGYAGQPIQLTLETRDLVTIDGAENVTFDGITFTGTRANAIHGAGDGITVKNCTIQNVGESAIVLEGTHITVENNTITATGKAGVVLTGGDRAALSSSHNIVTNNLIYDWSQIYQTYQAAVSLNGVGAVCSHNEIYQSPHEAITYTGNNHVIEYNVIHDVVRKSSDAGAIYAGRSWSAYGNVIRYNCIYNLGSDGFTPNGIYFDDALSGQAAYGNLLINIPGRGFLLGGGRDLKVENNLIVNAAIPIEYDDRAIAGIEDGGWFSHANTPGEGLWATLKEVDIHSDVWKNAYPSLSKLMDDFSNRSEASFAANPAGSSVRNNVMVNRKKKEGEFAKRAKQYSEVSNFAYRFQDHLFEQQDTYLLQSPPDGFVQIPMEQIGRTDTLALS